MSTVIVFSPTGEVASVAARTAQEHGAKVVLAMRDPQKTIPGLSPDDERVGGFERVQADLTSADSVRAAVEGSGAKRAFLYLIQGTSDHMRATIKALKSGGIDFVVFLSSYTVQGEPRDIPPREVTPYIHAQVEVNLDDIFGPDNYVALRPGNFATNFTWYKDGINAGEVRLYAPNTGFDCIVPADIGRVGGTILVHGARSEQRKVYIHGPQILSLRDGVEIIGNTLGKQAVQITSINEQQAVDDYVRAGVTKPVAEYMARNPGATADDESERPFYETGVSNVQLYTGKPATSFKQWVEANKGLFSA